jgi:hypothetical protein
MKLFWAIDCTIPSLRNSPLSGVEFRGRAVVKGAGGVGEEGGRGEPVARSSSGDDRVRIWSCKTEVTYGEGGGVAHGRGEGGGRGRQVCWEEKKGNRLDPVKQRPPTGFGVRPPIYNSRETSSSQNCPLLAWSKPTGPESVPGQPVWRQLAQESIACASRNYTA